MSGAGEGGSRSRSPPADLSQLSEDDLLAWGKEELVQRLRQAEADKIAALVQRGRLIQEVNRQLQGHLREVRELKAVNGQLQGENQELRDLCCFLDEDRLKVKGLAREWQAFGRYAARVMREDVGGYLRKLANLERLQEALVRENLDLRELCSEEEEEERAATSDASPAGSSDLNILPCGPRDLGDGSSSTGSVGSPDQTHLACSPED
ncbi:coiled-coil domain-containing protein 85B [Carcharodon carcharias]|uniref:coiled-coil domain-containing protein 85B n=1 Tax=Carcharodon carcharias TaxID=13397 RepID=UPI001B7E2417|nr:coiled-coil domain-containing protein 85B [Carcharodon carcharias]